MVWPCHVQSFCESDEASTQFALSVLPRFILLTTTWQVKSFCRLRLFYIVHLPVLHALSPNYRCRLTDEHRSSLLTSTMTLSCIKGSKEQHTTVVVQESLIVCGSVLVYVAFHVSCQTLCVKYLLIHQHANKPIYILTRRCTPNHTSTVVARSPCVDPHRFDPFAFRV